MLRCLRVRLEVVLAVERNEAEEEEEEEEIDGSAEAGADNLSL
jgi:hypothetical protein